MRIGETKYTYKVLEPITKKTIIHEPEEINETVQKPCQYLKPVYKQVEINANPKDIKVIKNKTIYQNAGETLPDFTKMSVNPSVVANNYKEAKQILRNAGVTGIMDSVASSGVNNTNIKNSAQQSISSKHSNYNPNTASVNVPVTTSVYNKTGVNSSSKPVFEMGIGDGFKGTSVHGSKASTHKSQPQYTSSVHASNKQSVVNSINKSKADVNGPSVHTSKVSGLIQGSQTGSKAPSSHHSQAVYPSAHSSKVDNLVPSTHVSKGAPSVHGSQPGAFGVPSVQGSQNGSHFSVHGSQPGAYGGTSVHASQPGMQASMHTSQPGAHTSVHGSQAHSSIHTSQPGAFVEPSFKVSQPVTNPSVHMSNNVPSVHRSNKGGFGGEPSVHISQPGGSVPSVHSKIAGTDIQASQPGIYNSSAHGSNYYPSAHPSQIGNSGLMVNKSNQPGVSVHSSKAKITSAKNSAKVSNIMNSNVQVNNSQPGSVMGSFPAGSLNNGPSGSINSNPFNS